MGWFSDALFGKRKKLDQSKIDDYMAPSRAMFEKQTNIAEQMMDPRSQLNLQQQALLRQQSMDTMSQQNQDLQATAAMRGVSPGQAMAMQRAQMSSGRGELGGLMSQMYQNQFGAGLNLYSQMAGEQKGMDEQRANIYMQQINAHNQRRAQNVGFASSLLGGVIGGLDFGGGKKTTSKMDDFEKRLAELEG